MNKKLLTAAIAAVIAAPTAALANDVTIYGVIHASVDYRTDDWTNKFQLDPNGVRSDGGISGSSDDNGALDGFDVASRATRIGFKGSEDLANGLKAIWKIEAQADIADLGGTCGARMLGTAPYGQNSPTLNQGVVGYSVNPVAFQNSWRATSRAAVVFEDDRENYDKNLAALIASVGSTESVAAGTPSACQTTDWWTARNAYIGLAGGWGTFLVGRHDTPYKMSTGSMDLFADTLADYNSMIGFVDLRTNSAIAYVSPSWSGFSFAGAMVAPQLYSSNGSQTADADSIAEAYSLALSYNNYGFTASVAYENVSDTWIQALVGAPAGIPSYAGSSDLQSVDSNEKLRFGLGWAGAGFTIGGIYEMEDNMIGFTKGTDADRWQVQAGYTFGNNMIKAMYGQGDWSGPFAYYGLGTISGRTGVYDVYARDRLEGDSTAWAIGLDHNFSKRTKAYILYANADYTYDYKQDAATYRRLEVGSESSPNESGRVINAKTDGSAGGFSIGMIHTF
jgi:predicted porin